MSQSPAASDYLARATTVDLFAECLRQFSELELDYLRTEIEPKMPAHFLHSTLRLNQPLQKYEKKIEETVAWLSEPNGKHQPWRNPEVYCQIALLAQTASNGNSSKTMDALRVHSGLIDPEAADLADGIWRLAHLNGTIYLVEGGERRDLSGHIVARIDSFPGLVFLPFPGLFADLIEPSLYPSTTDPFDRSELLATLGAALDLLADYSPELISDLKRVIQTIVLVPNIGNEQRWSYNLRLAYFGAIFINPFVVGREGIAEALIHEYYHQRFWQWWAYDPPDGLPREDLLINSPVTQRAKPARVMLQAFVIYTAVHMFYVDRMINNPSPDPHSAKWSADRIELLAPAIVELHKSLRGAIPKNTRAGAMLDYVWEYSQAQFAAGGVN